MKFIHLSDLHIGKRVNEFSMIEDQIFILNQILDIIDRVKPDGIIIAGDIYDKTMPSEEAVHLLNDFICSLADRNLRTYIISGNHDSAERLSFGSKLMNRSGIFICPAYSGNVVKHVHEDEYGQVNIYMLPFIKPAHIRSFFPNVEITNYTDAVKTAIDSMEIDIKNRNILITHQFVTGAKRSESEEISVGGSDNVDSSVLSDFDYVALGHIHGPQQIERKTIRYCGTPLKYSFSEVSHVKSVTIVTLNEKGNVTIETEPLVPMRDMRIIRGTYNEITHRANYENTNTEDYIQIVLTDEEDVPDAIGRLRVIYPNIMQLKYDNKRTKTNQHLGPVENIEERKPIELFAEFYEKQNNQAMTEEQTRFVSSLIERIWGE